MNKNNHSNKKRDDKPVSKTNDKIGNYIIDIILPPTMVLATTMTISTIYDTHLNKQKNKLFETLKDEKIYEDHNLRKQYLIDVNDPTKHGLQINDSTIVLCSDTAVIDTLRKK